MNETVKNLVSRKSCNCYQKKHVPAEAIEDIVAAGLNAPSGMNRQTPIFVVVQDEDTVRQLSRLNAAAGIPMEDPFYGAQDVICVLARKETTYIYDGSLAMGNLMNAAWSMGIDSRWIHRCKEVFSSDEGRALLQKWGITADVEGIGFCLLGYAEQEKEKTEIQPNRVYYVR